ncbi:MAG: hypothetical protein ABID40_02160 [Candidatus Bipolaricaulota bacterium]
MTCELCANPLYRCSTCGSCYPCSHEAIWSPGKKAWFWACPDGRIKFAFPEGEERQVVTGFSRSDLN